jgi:hypothetical protein
MIEDMRMRKLTPKTREAYIRAVRKFAKFLGRSHGKDTLGEVDSNGYDDHDFPSQMS